MSNKKVNSKMLKNLIKEVLEEKINLTYTGDKAVDRKASVGLPSRGKPFDSEMYSLVNIDNSSGKDVFDDEDLKAVTKGTPEYKTANTWFKKSSKAPSGFSDVDSYIASLGGTPSGSTFFYQSAGTKNLKTGLHLKNKPTKGSKNAIAKALKTYIDASPTPTNADVQKMIDEITAIFGKEIGTGNLFNAVNDAKAILGGAPPNSPISNALKTKLADIATSLETASTQDITAPMIQDVGSAGTTTSTGGSFPPGLITPLNDMFSGLDTYEKRLKKLSDVSDLLVNGDEDTITASYKGNEREFLRDIIIMDYFATIFREVDDRAIAYYFEALGALIGGGKVAGAGGESGDFTVAVSAGQQNFEGSSKFYQSGSASGQSLSGFVPGVEVLYLVAKKSVSVSQQRTVLPIVAYTVRLDAAPSYDGADHVNNLQISTSPANLFIGKSTGRGSGAVSKITAISDKAKKVSPAHGVPGQIQPDDYYYHLRFGPKIAGTEFNIHFAKGRTRIKTLKNLLDQATSKTGFDSKLKKAYDSMKTYFEKMKLSQSSIKDYIGSDNVKKGSDALDALTEADSSLVSLITSYGGRKITTTGTKRTVSENKITSNFLKKIIQETLKK